MLFGQQIQSTASKNESALILAQGVPDRHLKRFITVCLGYFQRNVASPIIYQNIVKTDCRHFIASLDLIVVRLVDKRKRHHALLLQIRFMDPGKAFGEDDSAS